MGNAAINDGRIKFFPLVPDENSPEKTVYVVRADDGKNYSINKIKFQIGRPIPDTIECFVGNIGKDGRPYIRQNVRKIILDFYEKGGTFDFVVSEDHTVADQSGFYKVKDEHGLLLNLTEFGTRRLHKGQQIKCRVRRSAKTTVTLTLIDEGSDKTCAITVEDLLNHTLDTDNAIDRYCYNLIDREIIERARNDRETGVPLWPVDALEHMSAQLNDWLVKYCKRGKLSSSRVKVVQHVLRALSGACMYMLEGCDYLAGFPSDTSRCGRERLSDIIRQTDYRLTAVKLVADSQHEKFIRDLLAKLKLAGYIYRPHDGLSILMNIFMLRPELINVNMAHIFEVTRGWGERRVMEEPFRSAFVSQLEIYIRQNCSSLDNLSVIGNAVDNAKVSQMIESIAIQSLIADPAKDSVDLDANRSRLYRYLTLPGAYGSERLLRKAFDAVMGGTAGRPVEFEWKDTAHVTTLLTKCVGTIGGDTRYSIRTFTGARARAIIEGRTITLMPQVPVSMCNDIFDESTLAVQGLQIAMPEKVSTRELRSNAIGARYSKWSDIERLLMLDRAMAHKSAHTPIRPGIGDEVTVTVESVDSADQRLLCAIINSDDSRVKYEGEGWLNYEDIVAYEIRPGYDDFLDDESHEQLVFKVRTVGYSDDGKMRFEMKNSVIEPFVKQQVLADITARHIAAITNNRGNNYSAITREGYTLWLPKTDEFSTLKPSTYVRARVTRAENGLNIYGEIIELATDTEMFSPAVTFHNLMQAVAIGSVAASDDDDFDPMLAIDDELPADRMIALARIVLRYAELQDDYLKTFDLVAFARLMALMAGDEQLAADCEAHKQLIRLMFDYDRNNAVDSERLISIGKGKMTRQATLLLYEKLFIADSMGNDERNNTLRDYIDNGNTDDTCRLARLALAYNMLHEAGVKTRDEDIVTGVRALLNVSTTTERAGKYYGNENLYTEFKMSIIYPARRSGSHITPDPVNQMHHILERITGMLNAKGGKIYIGVNDLGYAAGVVDDLAYLSRHESGEPKDKFGLHVRNAIHEHLGQTLGRLITCDWDTESGDRPVYIINISPSPDLALLDGVAWERQDTSTTIIKEKDIEAFVRERHRIFAAATSMPEVVAGDEQPVVTPEHEDVAAKSQQQENVVPVYSPTVMTATLRANALHAYDETYVDDVVAYLYLIKGGKYRVTRDDFYYDASEPEMIDLALVIHEDEVSGWLALVYDDTEVVKVPMSDIIDKSDRGDYNYLADHRLVAAVPMRPDDQLILILDYAHKCYYRTVAAADLQQGSMTGGGECLCTTVKPVVTRVERAPQDVAHHYAEGRNVKSRQAGVDVKPGRDTVDVAVDRLLKPIEDAGTAGV